jgi:hypothetical protein
MSQVEQRYVPPSHRPMPGESNVVAATVEAERASGSQRPPRTAAQVERDIAERQKRLAESTAELKEVMAPQAVARRARDKASQTLHKVVDGHETEIVGAVVGVIVVLLVVRAVRDR